MHMTQMTSLGFLWIQFYPICCLHSLFNNMEFVSGYCIRGNFPGIHIHIGCKLLLFPGNSSNLIKSNIFCNNHNHNGDGVFFIPCCEVKPWPEALCFLGCLSICPILFKVIFQEHRDFFFHLIRFWWSKIKVITI